MATPHNQANKNEIAKIVIMPGDPLRAKFIAETFLEDVVEFNSVRNMLGYTGKYQGKLVSVMGSGMGMPSIGIYSYELFTMYDVDVIVRVGSAGAYSEELKLFDTILVESAYSESTFAKVQGNYDRNINFPSPIVNEALKESAKQQNIPLILTRIHSSDVFYRQEDAVSFETIRDTYGCSCVEMESFALFHNAMVTGKKAACLLTISDSLVTHQQTSALQRQQSFKNMMKVALGLVHQL